MNNNNIKDERRIGIQTEELANRLANIFISDSFQDEREEYNKEEFKNAFNKE